MVADVVVPVSAVLVSAGVAVWLANRERKAAAAARVEERKLIVRERRLAKTEEWFEQILGTLSWFISANPYRDDWAPQMRLLRGQAVVAQAVSERDLQEFGEWFAAEIERGLGEASRCFVQFGEARPRLSAEGVELAVEQIMGPFRFWVKHTMDLVVIWLRGGTSVDEIRRMSDEVARVRWDSERLADAAARRGGAPI